MGNKRRIKRKDEALDKIIVISYKDWIIIKKGVKMGQLRLLGVENWSYKLNPDSFTPKRLDELIKKYDMEMK